MITTAAIVLALVVTLALPIFPDGLEPTILVFFGLAALGALTGLLRRAARHELVALSPWFAALLIALIVGALSHGDSRQSIEDAIPYCVFLMGLVAGRGSAHCRIVLLAVFAVCVADSTISLWLMPGFEPGFRSTYTYHKIIGGLPLVGIFLARFLGDTDERGGSPRPFRVARRAIGRGIMWVAMVASVSRGMMLAWLLGTAVVGYLRRPSRALAVGVFITVALLVYSTTFSEFGGRYLRTDQPGTINARYQEIIAAWDAFTRSPLFGDGLGASLAAGAPRRAYVHNMAIYHLWKFGLVGTFLLVLPFLVVGRQLWRSSPDVRAVVIGGAASIAGYLVTCAAYKNYYVVWIHGVVVGAILTSLVQLRRRQEAGCAEPGAYEGLTASGTAGPLGHDTAANRPLSLTSR